MKKILIFIITVIFLVTGSKIHAQGRFALSYNTSIALGETNDFVSKYSFRGIGMEGRWQLSSSDIYMGWSAAWNVFYKKETGAFNNDTRTTSGIQYKYINTVPILLTGFKYFKVSSDGLNIYAGLGAGTYYVEQRRDFGLWSETTGGWLFGLAPELGILVPTVSTSDVLISIRYNYAFKTSSVPSFSSLGINLGLIF